MKKVTIVILPLILFAAFLSFKPPAVSAVNKPATDQVTTEPAQTTPLPNATKNVSPKPLVIQGGDDEDDDEDDDHDDKGRDHKPSYGGHDDDDYDDD